MADEITNPGIVITYPMVHASSAWLLMQGSNQIKDMLKVGISAQMWDLSTAQREQVRWQNYYISIYASYAVAIAARAHGI